MPVIARDSFAAGQLVYPWPFPIGPECEVSCRDDEQVVMCPAWTLGDRLGPGRHLWRTPDPTRPVAAYFVSFGAVEVEFEFITRFVMPATSQPIQIRAAGAVLIRCSDPGVLVAQFIGLPFDLVDEGIRRSVARSVERMVARLLTRRVVLGGGIEAITEPSMLSTIVAEIVSYNPTAGAVFGVELSQFSRLQIEASDGHTTLVSPPPVFAQPEVVPEPQLPETPSVIVNGWEAVDAPSANGEGAAIPEPVLPRDTMRGVASGSSGSVSGVISGSISSKVAVPKATPPPTPPPRRGPGAETLPPPLPSSSKPPGRAASPSVTTTTTKEVAAEGSSPRAPRLASEPEVRSSIMAVGARIGDSQVTSGEILAKVEPGKRVLVPGPHGLMQSATVRQLLSGYYELEVGASGETIWVPMAHVVPE